MVFIFDKVKLRVILFRGHLGMGCMGHGRNNTQSLCPKFRFSHLAPDFTSTQLLITQNLVEDCFLYILINFEVKRTSFAEAKKKIQDDDFYPKNPS